MYVKFGWSQYKLPQKLYILKEKHCSNISLKRDAKIKNYVTAKLRHIISEDLLNLLLSRKHTFYTDIT